jgi:hypothetical protein
MEPGVTDFLGPCSRIIVAREVTMFQRFAAGTAVASIVIAIAAIILSVIPGPKFERIYPSPFSGVACRSPGESGPR